MPTHDKNELPTSWKALIEAIASGSAENFKNVLKGNTPHLQGVDAHNPLEYIMAMLLESNSKIHFYYRGSIQESTEKENTLCKMIPQEQYYNMLLALIDEKKTIPQNGVQVTVPAVNLNFGYASSIPSQPLSKLIDLHERGLLSQSQFTAIFNKFVEIFKANEKQLASRKNSESDTDINISDAPTETDKETYEAIAQSSDINYAIYSAIIAKYNAKKSGSSEAVYDETIKTLTSLKNYNYYNLLDNILNFSSIGTKRAARERKEEFRAVVKGLLFNDNLQSSTQNNLPHKNIVGTRSRTQHQYWLGFLINGLAFINNTQEKDQTGKKVVLEPEVTRLLQAFTETLMSAEITQGEKSIPLGEIILSDENSLKDIDSTYKEGNIPFNAKALAQIFKPSVTLGSIATMFSPANNNTQSGVNSQNDTTSSIVSTSEGPAPGH